MELAGENMSEKPRGECLDRQQLCQDCEPCGQEDRVQVAGGSQSPSPSPQGGSLILRRAHLSPFNRSLSRSSRRSHNWATGTDTARLSVGGGSTRRKGLKEILFQSSEAKPIWLEALPKGDTNTSSISNGQRGPDPHLEANLEDLSLALDPLEHEWMLTVAQGDAGSILRLLDQDPSLLSRPDFVTGFPVLHWLAKHGRHEDLIEVITFAEKRRYPVDVNVFSASGRLTPLHLAALQGHEMLIKVLVGAYGANTSLRDHNGLQAWQYLRADAPRELKELLGACEEDLALLGAGNTNNNCLSSRRGGSNRFKRDCKDFQGEGNSRRAITGLTSLRNLFRQAIAFFQEM